MKTIVVVVVGKARAIKKRNNWVITKIKLRRLKVKPILKTGKWRCTIIYLLKIMRKRQFGSTKIILNLGALILIFDCSVFKYETECAFDIFMFNVFYKENKRSIKNWL